MVTWHITWGDIIGLDSKRRSEEDNVKVYINGMFTS